MTRFQVEERRLVPFEVKDSELLTLTDAAKRLGLSTSAMGDLVYRGVLRRVVDTLETNRTWQTRVLVAEVDREMARRRARRRGEGDGRLRGKVR